MKNNKGFSLVELIIVIAIMAILVGVMAPQLIKYIEKANASADAQLADTVHSAVIDAALDPEVATASTTGIPSGGVNIISSPWKADSPLPFQKAVCEILGVASTADLRSSLKSNGPKDNISVTISGNNVTVLLPGTDSRGSKAASGYEIRVPKP